MIWKAVLKHSHWLIILILLIIIVLQQECHHCPPCLTTDTIITTHTDTITITHNHYLPAPLPDTIINTDTIFPDTAAILADYSALKIYNRTLLDDSTGKISLLDSVQFNALQGSQLSAVYFQKQTDETITHTVYQPNPPKLKVFAGLTAGSSVNFRSILVPQLSFLTKKDHFYSFGFDPLNKSILFSNAWLIKFHPR